MKRTGIKIIKAAGKVLLGLFLSLFAIVALVYTPVFQESVLPKVLQMVNKGGDMEISLSHFRLSFPAHVEIDSLLILQKGDTMLSARQIDAKVALLPLLCGNVKVDHVNLDDIFYGSGTPDSTLFLRTEVSKVRIGSIGVGLSASDVDISKALVSGGRIHMAVKNDTTPPTPPSDVPWRIRTHEIELKDIDFQMNMASTGDSLATLLPELVLNGGDINLREHQITIDRVSIDRLGAAFLTPPEPIAVPPSPYDSIIYPSVPWNISLTKLTIDSAAALYGVRGAVPQPGLDMSCLQLNHLNVDIDSLAMMGTNITVPVRNISGVERCGLSFVIDGTLAMDSTEFDVSRLNINTPGSKITLDAVCGLGGSDPAMSPVDVDARAEISATDLRRMFPSMNEMIDGLPVAKKIELVAQASGTLADLDVSGVSLDIPDHMLVKLSGKLKNPTDFDHIDGAMKISGNIRDVDFMRKQLLTGSSAGFNIPKMKLDGDVAMHNGTATADFKVETADGRLAADGMWKARKEAYDLDLTTHDFPVNSFLPNLGVGHLTASVRAVGHGLDPFSPSTELDAEVVIQNMEYNSNNISDLRAKADMHDSRGDFSLFTHNPGLWVEVTATSNLNGPIYDWVADVNLHDLNLERMGLADTVFDIHTDISFSGTVNSDLQTLVASGDIRNLDVVSGATVLKGNDIGIAAAAGPDTTRVRLSNRSFCFDFTSPLVLDSLTTRFSEAAAVVTRHIDAHRADIPALQQVMPRFELAIESSGDNILSSFLAGSDISFRDMKLRLSNDSLINMTAHADSVISGATRIDRLNIDMNQKGKFLAFKAKMDNDPGTWDNFAHVAVNGYLAEDKFAFFGRQKNIQDATGYNIGAVISMTDSIYRLKFIPYNPVIAYKEWSVNKDNFLSYNPDSRDIGANLKMMSGDSYIHLYTQPDSVGHVPGREDLFVHLHDIKLEDWMNVNPYSPKIKGSFDSHMEFKLSRDEISGKGNLGVEGLVYGNNRVGDIGMNFDLGTTSSGFLYAVTDMNVNGRKVMDARGTLNDTTALHPMMLDLNLTDFPLDLANPFIGAKTATLDGTVNGRMDVTGTLGKPVANGYIAFDSAQVKVAMLGSTFRFSNDKVPVDSNLIRFDNFRIFGMNNNSLTANGEVNMRNLSDIRLDLALRARNWQVVKNDKKKGADVYGRAFVNLDATAKGSLNFIDADVSLTVLPETNVTYVIASATSNLQMTNNSDIVKFVNFNDTTQVARADSVAPSSGMMLNLSALLNVQQGSTIGVDLSSDGKNRVQLKSSGTIDYSVDYMGDERTTGRLNINGGYVRYTPPFMSEKMFDFQEGSYVAFNGNMMNPVLNVHAVDKVKANITSQGANSRLIDFDVALNVTGNLSNMDVAFDLSTNGDATVENELQSMSPEQRANQAMNLLLYNVYTGPGTKGDAGMIGNPLYTFLESTLNSWMANNIKAVDISFGIDQYDRTVDGSSSQTTSYSYKVSKTFLNDRFKIVIGGNYTTDADPDQNLSQNLISDVSFEYMLNRSGSMYVRLFRHTGYESILEGEITQTGVGFVYKRKIRRVSDLFRFARRKPRNNSSESAPAAAPETSVQPDAAPQETATETSNHQSATDDEK